MNTRRALQSALLSLLVGGFAVLPSGTPAQHSTAKKSALPKPTSQDVPVTTSSSEAREDYDMGMWQREDLLYTEDGVEFFRQAVKVDPHFALGHAALAYFSTDPKESRTERRLARTYMVNVTHDERLLIRWMNGTKDGELVPAIAAMNDLMARYPEDKRLANLYAEWLCSQQQNFDHGSEILDNLLKKDPNYYPALNNLAYCYALGGKVELAPPLMDRYVVLLPGQPNPQDSYAEILRMSGNFQGALEHYRAALKISAKFTSSQVGVASTYALMGDQPRAREEYAKAFDMTRDASTRVGYKMLWAMTYYREGQSRIARKAFSDLDQEAHENGLTIQEAEIHRIQALFNPDFDGAIRDLDDAQSDLSKKVDLAAGERNVELATILQTRAFLCSRAGKPALAQKAYEQLATVAENSRDNLVQLSYHSAKGAALLAKGKYSDAIEELGEDPRNPLSLDLLADAQSKLGQSADGQKTLVTLAAINDERVETAFAVPQARAALRGSPAISAQAQAAH
jgi:tetratricopeptide (TPR) repeat protein